MGGGGGMMGSGGRMIFRPELFQSDGDFRGLRVLFYQKAAQFLVSYLIQGKVPPCYKPTTDKDTSTNLTERM
jgi:hypothetical protein